MKRNTENDMDYPSYIGSSAWRRSPARLKVLAEAAGHCRLCHAEARLEVHHATYQRLGCEHDTDLIPLCRDCHRDVTSFLRARRYAVAVPRRADVLRLSDTRVVSNDPTAGGY
jgi:5-methylcytosine-specific restriction endonuclease McrA